MQSHSCVHCRVDRHLNTCLYNGLCFAVEKKLKRMMWKTGLPHHPFFFFKLVSLAFPSFPPTLPCCASLPLTLLSCFKSTSFPLSMILPLPPPLLLTSSPFSSFSYIPRSVTFFLCLPEWQVSSPDAKLLLWGSCDDTATSSMCIYLCVVVFFLFCMCFGVYIMPGVEGWQGETERRETYNWAPAVLDEAFNKYVTREAKMRI